MRPDEQRREKEFNEQVITIDRVSRVVKGGRRFRFRALVVVGDNKSKIGVGISKSGDVQGAIAKAVEVAKKNMIEIAVEKETISHDTTGRVAGANVMLMPAKAGTGIIAGGTVRAVLSVTGIKNIMSKSLGSSNKINVAYATVEALKAVVPRSEWMNQPEKSSESKEATSKETAKSEAK